MLRFRQQMLRSGTREGSGSISEQERGYPTTLAEPWPLSPQTPYPRGRTRTLCNPHAPADPVLSPMGDRPAHSGKCFQAGGRASTQLAAFRHLFPFPLSTFPGPALASLLPSSPDPSGPSFPLGLWEEFVVNNTSQSCGNIIIKIYIN